MVGKIPVRKVPEMGLYGSVWVHIEGIRARMGENVFDMAKRGLGGRIILKSFFRPWSGIIGKNGKCFFPKTRQICMNFIWVAGSKNLSWTCGSVINPMAAPLLPYGAIFFWPFIFKYFN